ncbi:MAG: HAMP domain-containing histidine kinase [Verrucomicrobia bacterium]|nr:HAMP domain-containing histidine kinase [Verrucomicrobiota bacterium]MBU4292053.1 HAMP domain-containing histidine kinase [Verrucomicrobiota bacterium]MBU4428148.1 HAMP domain-containing histidine kinase [Verrucomicrobiota bacterium]MCG2678887.1 HAMP domain-containing histidine kinase [Kiritimatiellia bacterium]
MKTDVIAIIGAGKGGTAILETLLKMPSVFIKHVCDVNPSAPGITLARQHGIQCHTQMTEICQDKEVDSIFEVTGRKEIFAQILANKQENTRVIGSEDARIIFHLLDLQQEVSDRLEDNNLILERRVLERTMELEKANTELEKKIIEYEKLNEKLLLINNEKTKYLMHATHQLKAPFAAIQSYADLILDGYAGKIPRMTLDIIKKIKERCLLLTDAIQDMLELANLRSLVRENIKMELYPLDSIITSVANHMAELAASRKVLLSVPATGDIMVKCNKNQILIMLSNLLENAIYYSPSGATATIAIKEDPNSSVRISIIDYGIGIDEKYQSRIFDEYFRANQAVEVNERGTGLGLAIVKEIAQVHETNIEVESVPGKGSVFSFHLKTAQKHKDD